MKKIFLTLSVVVLCFASIANAVWTPGASSKGYIWHEVQVVDEFGNARTDVNSVTIRTAGSTDAQTIYHSAESDSNLYQPMAWSSTNTTLDYSNGTFWWYGTVDSWDFTISLNSSITYTNNGHMACTSGTRRIIFPSYIAAVNTSAFTLTDAQVATFGTDGDWTMGSSGATLQITPVVGTEATPVSFNIGANTAGADFKLFGATTGVYALWDSSADELLLSLGDFKISQGSQIEFIDITDGATDWTIDNATDETLLVMPTETTDDQTINLGDADHTTDLRTFGKTASTVVFDASADKVIFDAYDIRLQDGDILNFGDSDDFTMTATNTTFTIQDLQTDESSIINVGADQDGIDLKLFGATASNYLLWDASGDKLIFDGADILVYDDDILNFGDSLEFAVYYDEATTDNLLIVALNANDAVQVGDGTTGTDFICQSTGDASAQVQFDASGDTANGQWLFGADDHGVDAIFYGATASQNVTWDQSADTWYYGADAEGVDVKFFGDNTGNYAFWDENLDTFVFVDGNIKFDDDAIFYIGTGTNVTTADGDFTIQSVSDTRMDITSTAANGQVCIGDGVVATDFLIDNITVAGNDIWFDQSADTANGVWYFGVNATGVDVLFYGTTTGQGVTWDSSADEWLFGADAEGVDVTFYADTSGNYMKWDENGSTNGALVFEDSIIQMMDDTLLVFGDGSDASLQYDEDGDNNLQLSGTALCLTGVNLVFEGSSADEHEATITATNPTADVVWTLPDAGAMTVSFMASTLATNMPGVANSVTGGTNQLIFEGADADGNETILTATAPTEDRTITFPDASGTAILTGRTLQRFTQNVCGAKLGSTGAGWVLDAADDIYLATLPASQTGEKMVIPVTVPLKVGTIITGFSVNGQVESAGGAVTVDASLNKMTAVDSDFTTAAVASIAQVAKTADYKIVDANSSINETVAADETFFVIITATTAGSTDVAIGGITVTVTEP